MTNHPPSYFDTVGLFIRPVNISSQNVHYTVSSGTLNLILNISEHVSVLLCTISHGTSV